MFNLEVKAVSANSFRYLLIFGAVTLLAFTATSVASAETTVSQGSIQGINGDYGRTPRIEVDGLDVSDETVGTTTQNIALSSASLSSTCSTS